jgi:hypothetical protein
MRNLNPEVLRSGPDQSFNSLDAQREACEAYIRSQKHEGWVPVFDPVVVQHDRVRNSHPRMKQEEHGRSQFLFRALRNLRMDLSELQLLRGTQKPRSFEKAPLPLSRTEK